jgi:hypothetical protein
VNEWFDSRRGGNFGRATSHTNEKKGSEAITNLILRISIGEWRVKIFLFNCHQATL